MQFFAQIGPGQRADLRAKIGGRTDLARRHAVDEALFKGRAHLLHHDEALGRDAALSAVDEARPGAHLGGEVEVGIGQNHIRVAAAEFQHALFEGRPGQRGNLPARGGAAGEGDRLHVRMADECGHAIRADEQGLEHSGWQAGFPEGRFDGERASADVGGMLEQNGVAGHEGGHHRAEDLPVGEIPRHDGQNHAQRLKGDEAVLGRARGPFIGEQTRGMLGVILAHERTFTDLGARLGQRLAHFAGHEMRVNAGFAPQHRCHRAQQPGAAGESNPAPVEESGVRAFHRRGLLPGGMLTVTADQSAGGGIEGDERHEDETIND